MALATLSRNTLGYLSVVHRCLRGRDSALASEMTFLQVGAQAPVHNPPPCTSGTGQIVLPKGSPFREVSASNERRLTTRQMPQLPDSPPSLPQTFPDQIPSARHSAGAQESKMTCRLCCPHHAEETEQRLSEGDLRGPQARRTHHSRPSR